MYRTYMVKKNSVLRIIREYTVLLIIHRYHQRLLAKGLIAVAMSVAKNRTQEYDTA